MRVGSGDERFIYKELVIGIVSWNFILRGDWGKVVVEMEKEDLGNDFEEVRRRLKRELRELGRSLKFGEVEGSSRGEGRGERLCR